MPAVCDLNGRRRALPRALGIGAGSVTADQFNTGMLLEPVCQRRRFAVRKQINCRAPLEIYQDRAVTLPFVLRPIINSDDFWGGRRWQLNLANPLNERICANVHSQGGSQSGSCLPAHGQPDQTQRLVQSERSAGVRRDECWNAFAEDMLGAIRVATVKTPRLNLQPDGNPQPRQIRESPNLSAVQVSGRRMTPGTERRPRRRFYDQRNPTGFELDAFQTQKVRIDKKMSRIHL